MRPNRQNVVKVSHFRSNDAIQKWLVDEYLTRTVALAWGTPRRRYARKRQKHFPAGDGDCLQLKLEEPCEDATYNA